MAWVIKIIWPLNHEHYEGHECVEYCGPFRSPFWTRESVEVERSKWIQTDRSMSPWNRPIYIVEEVN